MDLIGHSDSVNCLDFSKLKSNVLASGSLDLTIIIWDIEKKVELQVLKGHTNSISCVVFSPDDNTISSGGYDKNILIWDW